MRWRDADPVTLDAVAGDLRHEARWWAEPRVTGEPTPEADMIVARVLNARATDYTRRARLARIDRQRRGSR